jgi:hypothetical protein
MRNTNTTRSSSVAAAAAIAVTLLGGIAAAFGPVDQSAFASGTTSDTYAPGGANPAPSVFDDLPGAVVTMDVPPGATRIFLATFSAEAACFGTPAGWCQARILIGGVEALPAAGVDFAFDSNDAGTANSASWEARSMQRYRRITNTSSVPMPVPIVVQRTTTDVGISLRTDDWALTVLRVEP